MLTSPRLIRLSTFTQTCVNLVVHVQPPLLNLIKWKERSNRWMILDIEVERRNNRAATQISSEPGNAPKKRLVDVENPVNHLVGIIAFQTNACRADQTPV